MAKRISQTAKDGGVTVGRVNDRVCDTCGAVNCYPGVPTDTCYDKAFFVSLEGHAKRRSSRGHLSQEQLFVEFNRHFTICPDTRMAVIICDTWHAPTYDRWLPIIKAIAKRGVHIEFYFIEQDWTVALPVLP